MSNETKLLCLETLHLIPGLKDDFDEQYKRLVEDCSKRSSLQKARKIKIELSLTPHENDPDDVVVETTTSSRMPARVIDPIRGRRTKTNQLRFDLSVLGEFERND